MDRFVVRTPRSPSVSGNRKGRKKQLKQATIKCLKVGPLKLGFPNSTKRGASATESSA